MGEEDTKVHVGNLPYRITEDELRETFEKYGNVNEVNIIMDRDTGRAKGFAFLTYENSDDAKDAIDGLNDTELGGRNIKVNKARPRGGGGRRYGGGGGYSDSYGGGSYGGGGGGYGGGRSSYPERNRYSQSSGARY